MLVALRQVVWVLVLAGCVSAPPPAADARGDAPDVAGGVEGLQLVGGACDFWAVTGREDADAVEAMLPAGVQHRYGVGPAGVGFHFFVACGSLALGAVEGRGALVAVGTHVESPARDNGDYVLWYYTDRADLASALRGVGYDARLASIDASYPVDLAGGGRIHLGAHADDDWVEVEGVGTPARCVGEPTAFFPHWAGGPDRWLRMDATMLGGFCSSGLDALVVTAMPGGAIARKAGTETHPATFAHGRSDLRMTVSVVEP